MDTPEKTEVEAAMVAVKRLEPFVSEDGRNLIGINVVCVCGEADCRRGEEWLAIDVPAAMTLSHGLHMIAMHVDPVAALATVRALASAYGRNFDQIMGVAKMAAELAASVPDE